MRFAIVLTIDKGVQVTHREYLGFKAGKLIPCPLSPIIQLKSAIVPPPSQVTSQANANDTESVFVPDLAVKQKFSTGMK